jgi:Undecaprenyl-phosphate glucose phosphotransferase
MTKADTLDVAAPVGRTKSATAARRGPFRPELWLNVRQRRAARMSSHAFRLADLMVLWPLSLGWALAGGAPQQATVAAAAPVILAAIVLHRLSGALGLYRFPRDHRLSRHMADLAGVVLAAGAVGALLSLLLPGGDPGRVKGWIATVAVALAGLHLVWAALVARWRRNGALTPNIVIVGATRHAERLIIEALERREVNVLGVFDDRLARAPEALAGVPVLGRAEDLLKHRMIPYVDRIVVAIDPSAQARVRELTARLQTLPTEVSLLIDPQSADERDLALDKLARSPLAAVSAPASTDRRAFAKRLQDVIIGSIALVLATPILALCALAVRMDSPGPIFFRQRRHGFNHEEIVVWKFRSMRHDAADATASRQVSAGDDRVTRVGRILRSTSLDELPQLLNVLTGEMSLVGPRPHAIGMKTGTVESAALVADYAHRHRIKPGMTGWAAIHGSRGPLDTAEDVRRRVQLDVDYIDRQSFWLDMWIMIVTVPVLLGDRLAVR